jgi:hypothetical protein
MMHRWILMNTTVLLTYDLSANKFSAFANLLEGANIPARFSAYPPCLVGVRGKTIFLAFGDNSEYTFVGSAQLPSEPSSPSSMTGQPSPSFMAAPDLGATVNADTEKSRGMSPVGAGALAGAVILLAAVAGVFILYCRRRGKASSKTLNRGTPKWTAVPETSLLVNSVALDAFSSGIRSQEV